MTMNVGDLFENGNETLVANIIIDGSHLHYKRLDGRNPRL
jgi:hypothetical protein